MTHDELDPVDERLAPVTQALGRAVLGAAALEKVLLVDIARRDADRQGLTDELSARLSRLERQSAGALLETLRTLGIDAAHANQIADVIHRRNLLVHHFMEAADVVDAFTRGERIDELVDRIDAVAADCQRIINEIAPPAFSGLETIFGVPIRTLLEQMHTVDLERITDKGLREQLRLARTIVPRDLDLPGE